LRYHFLFATSPEDEGCQDCVGAVPSNDQGRAIPLDAVHFEAEVVIEEGEEELLGEENLASEGGGKGYSSNGVEADGVVCMRTWVVVPFVERIQMSGEQGLLLRKMTSQSMTNFSICRIQ